MGILDKLKEYREEKKQAREAYKAERKRLIPIEAKKRARVESGERLRRYKKQKARGGFGFGGIGLGFGTPPRRIAKPRKRRKKRRKRKYYYE